MLKLALASAAMLLAIGITGIVGLLIFGCALYQPAPHAGSALEGHEPGSGVSSGLSEDLRDDGEASSIRRVAVDLEATTEFANGEYRSGGCQITTPLPDGWPPPTPPGAIEIKQYCGVRRAGIGSKLPPDWGMNFAFWPLFNHIKRRDIAMTSPVEVSYDGLSESRTSGPIGWTMYFLYRAPELGPEGPDPQDRRILVDDLPPMTVVAIGMRGSYRLDAVRTGLAALRDWLTSQSEWEEAGQVRALFYNGPEVRAGSKWFEVQLPIRRR